MHLESISWSTSNRDLMQPPHPLRTRQGQGLCRVAATPLALRVAANAEGMGKALRHSDRPSTTASFPRCIARKAHVCLRHTDRLQNGRSRCPRLGAGAPHLRRTQGGNLKPRLTGQKKQHFCLSMGARVSTRAPPLTSFLVAHAALPP